MVTHLPKFSSSCENEPKMRNFYKKAPHVIFNNFSLDNSVAHYAVAQCGTGRAKTAEIEQT